jgi:glycerophosphoryl diester phosphodiesterase
VGTIEVVCHRGAWSVAPENTLAAARAAIDMGADYVEVDVNLSADGVHYVFHGPKLEGTTNGQGLFHQQNSDYLDGLDAGGWFGEAFGGERIPRLDAMLETLRGKSKVFFDVKRADLPVLVDMVAQFGLEADCFFWFGRDEDARTFHALAPHLPLKINVRTAQDIRKARQTFDAALVEVAPRHLSEGVIEACRALDMRLIVNYMGDNPAVFAELARWPIDLINLNYLEIWQNVVEGQPASRRDAVPPAGPATRRVVLFLLDGCRPDAIQQASTPAIDALIDRGSYSWRARSVMPSVTLPCHTSLFFSLPPDVHGVQSNNWHRPASPAQSLLEVLHGAGADTARFFTWDELRDLSLPGAVALSIHHRLSAEGLTAVGDAAVEHIAAHKPAFSFVYLEATDAVGHAYGWMSPEYLDAVTFSDAIIGRVIEGLRAGGDEAETVFVVMADHGGHDFGHGTEADEDMLIPLIMAGPGVTQGRELDGPAGLIDIAPTILRLMGISAPEHWQGKPIAQIVDDIQVTI